MPLPSGIGLEGAGIIEKVGPETNGFKEGDKVAYAAAPIGSYASHRIYPIKSLIKVDPAAIAKGFPERVPA